MSVATIDAHVTMAGVGFVDPGKVLMIMGTSTCHMVMDNERKVVAGISGVVMDGLIEGYWGYEAGQPCVGDLFDWFSNNCLPPSYLEEADNRDIKPN